MIFRSATMSTSRSIRWCVSSKSALWRMSLHRWRDNPAGDCEDCEHRDDKDQRPDDRHLVPVSGQHLESDKSQNERESVMQQAQLVERAGEREIERAQT